MARPKRVVSPQIVQAISKHFVNDQENRVHVARHTMRVHIEDPYQSLDCGKSHAKVIPILQLGWLEKLQELQRAPTDDCPTICADITYTTKSFFLEGGNTGSHPISLTPIFRALRKQAFVGGWIHMLRAPLLVL